jgi:predicted RNase H-like HicB family nuclease
MQYLVIVEKDTVGYGARVPDLPGCVAVGKSHSEVLQLIREGIELHLEVMRDAEECIPEPTCTGEMVSVRAAQFQP